VRAARSTEWRTLKTIRRDGGIEALEAASERTRAARVIKVTLVVGVALLVAVCAYTLTRSPPRVLRAAPKTSGFVTALTGDGGACQAEEVLPAGATAMRLSIGAFVGARIRVAAYSGSRLLTGGSRGPDWTGTSVTVPVAPLRESASNVSVCFDISPNSESLFVLGRQTPASEAMFLPNGERLSGRLSIAYLGPGRGSWWSRVLPVARRMGLGRAFSGTWIVLLVAVMVAAMGILAGRLALREIS
jgi:hypothetical protein